MPCFGTPHPKETPPYGNYTPKLHTENTGGICIRKLKYMQKYRRKILTENAHGKYGRKVLTDNANGKYGKYKYIRKRKIETMNGRSLRIEEATIGAGRGPQEADPYE